MEVKDLIAQWRTLNGELRVLNESLDVRRREFNEHDTAHAAAISEWDAKKSALQAAIAESLKTVEASERATAERKAEAERMLTSAHDRAARNAQQQRLLTERHATMSAQQREADEVSQRQLAQLTAFRQMRDQQRAQLQSALQKARDIAERERQDQLNRKAEATKQLEEAERAVAADEAAWREEVQSRRQRVKSEFRARLLQEEDSTVSSRKEWSALRSTLPPSTPQEMRRQLADLAQRLSQVRH